MSILNACFVILVFSGSLQVGLAQTISIPRGKAPVIDGRLSPSEWADAAAYDLKGGGRLMLKFDGSYFYAAVHGKAAGWSQLYLAEEDGREIVVRHASAALGSSVYKIERTGIWQPQSEFTWQLRDKDLSAATLAKMDEHLKTAGWVANNNNMNERDQFEFKWRPLRPGSLRFRMAVEYVVNDTKQYFPETWSDDGINSRLALGYSPRDLNFDVKGWALATAR